MRMLLLRLIRIYQVRISPRKGFHCAYRVRAQARSCSSFGFEAIERHGALVGLLLLLRKPGTGCADDSRSEASKSNAVRASDVSETAGWFRGTRQGR
jgi:hypothetical protein